MKKWFTFYFANLLFWFCLFILLKIIFLIYNAHLTAGLPIREIPLIFLHGFKMDLSASFYMMIFPTLMLIATPIIGWKIYHIVINIYTIIFLVIISLLIAIDLELYHYWNFRLDRTPLKYLDSPEVMVASVQTWEIIRQLLIAAALVLITLPLYRKLVKKIIPRTGKSHWIITPVFLFVLAFSIIPIRGGFGVAPMNSGFAYFSTNTFANHAALNMPFHAFESLVNFNVEENPFNEIAEETALSYCADLMKAPDGISTSVFNTSRPNIIIIVLESFTSKVVEPLGGMAGVTPNLNRLADEGILFTNFYATADRTDKVLPAILSGFTALPDQSVTKISPKSEKLPMLPSLLKKHGYHTAFYYGGTIDFAGLRSYLVSGNFDRIMDLKDFSPTDRTSKWGVHDNITFDSLFYDIKQAPSPFFKVLLSISSHEPYDVPMDPVFEGSDKQTLFLNSLYYTDSVLGGFIEKAKLQLWWSNTLVILVADHGTRLPGQTPNEAVEKFRIPMIWLGGALTVRDSVIDKRLSQTDILPTILEQMSLPRPENLLFGNDMFSNHHPSFAYYAFNNGFGVIGDSSSFVFDNVADRIIFSSGTITDSLIMKGKAVRQLSYDYFIGL